jgi:hypothetical protein
VPAARPCPFFRSGIGGCDQPRAGFDGRLQACGRQADFIDGTVVMTETILHVDDHQGSQLTPQLHG